MFTDTAKNTALDAITLSHVSAHTAFSATGASEVAGGAYARKAITVGAAAAGARSASTQPALDIPAGTTVRWLGAHDALTDGNIHAIAPLGGSPKKFIVNAGTDVIDSIAHGLVDNDLVVFYGGTAPGGLTEGDVYHVISATADTLQVSLTQGGAAINLTAEAALGCRLSKIVPETFGSAGQLQVNTGVFNLNS